jgi:hypothetical protein
MEVPAPGDPPRGPVSRTGTALKLGTAMLAPEVSLARTMPTRVLG